ncbi:tyrosine-protein phosphatase non-receptor type 11 [Capsaspora owczarzaki ATCC 30864]|uniref:protein-tyrosine-phosphatase n=1 Tax=Capsaspora owczarzaki (strain ATCC 30864) TaxID=595528 RepID=A0A0D2US50_CAPO3|nr:tyrosine-protein phosphatase non-receptor type 11 [Capsaspora owczarzaki ATCC 30864]KJE97790.1 tyrosine-protein phosphatase non-receptor type 11 [Capsaspora owczarzaki ATCC 30864]KJE97791.1 tyrosine-protein phosphatase non-receptor type 11, variant [Capsaspora owczarzaki ATCC 30864]|eukprot:XP_004342974.1 tyrosine-protein phosphatase non-receptor type 11 [Capsaspora owczarzaki ATCC 30864]
MASLPKLRTVDQGATAGKNEKHCTIKFANSTETTVVVNKDTIGQQLYDAAVAFIKLEPQDANLFGIALVDKYSDELFLALDRKFWKLVPSNKALFTVTFKTMFYLEDNLLVRNLSTRHMLYLQVQQDVLEGRLLVGDETALSLAAYSLQAQMGNYDRSKHGTQYFHSPEYLHNSVINRLSVQTLQQRVPQLHEALSGVSADEAELCYLLEAQHQKDYGVHFYHFESRHFDRQSLVGLSTRGIATYTESNGLRSVTESWSWADQVELRFHERKFVIQTADAIIALYFPGFKKARFVLEFATASHKYHRMVRTIMKELDDNNSYPALPAAFKYSYAVRSGVVEWTHSVNSKSQIVASPLSTLSRKVQYGNEHVHPTSTLLTPLGEKAAFKSASPVPGTYGSESKAAHLKQLDASAALAPGSKTHRQRALEALVGREHVIRQLLADLEKSIDEKRPQEEFETLRNTDTEIGQTYEAAQLSSNAPRNRYRNIHPYDSNRVLLSTAPDGHDYINASHIRIQAGARKLSYIATQGPTAGTLEDFWRMVWEQKSNVIVAGALAVENNKNKCNVYWHEQLRDTTVFGNFQVTLVYEQEFPDYIVRELVISDLANQQSRIVQQLHFLTWPDHDVPQNIPAALEFVHLVRERADESDGPVVVHCSAGIGRTGSIILIDAATVMFEQGLPIDALKLLQNMRTQRSGVVQTSGQYVFCYTALAQELREILASIGEASDNGSN